MRERRAEHEVLFSLFGIRAGAETLPEKVEIMAFDKTAGVFNYYDEEGELSKTEEYKAGRLIRSKKHRPKKPGPVVRATEPGSLRHVSGEASQQSVPHLLQHPAQWSQRLTPRQHLCRGQAGQCRDVDDGVGRPLGGES